jgi:hypothetical protein
MRPGDHGGSFEHFGVRGPQPLDDSVDLKKVIGSAILSAPFLKGAA